MYSLSWIRASITPFLRAQKEEQFERRLRKERGFIIKKMIADGACLFRAVGMFSSCHAHIVISS